MPRPKIRFFIRLSGFATLGIAFLFAELITSAYAQYRSSAPYSNQTSSLPRSTTRYGGITGNPYTRSRTAPTGLPVSGNRQSYFGTTGGGSAFGHQAVSKPFSNLQRPQPLITSREAAQIEVARGLWRY